MNFLHKLPEPSELIEKFPLSSELKKIKLDNDKEIINILNGNIDKFILVIGPCSADNPKAVLEYAKKIKELQDKVKDKIKIILRVYTAKSRTTGLGYMGLIHQPDPLGQIDAEKGIETCRKLFIDIIKETHLPIADEMLYPENYVFFEDLLSYAALGARSVLDQEHRLVASGMNIPVGIKNSLDGVLDNLANSIVAVRSPHRFVYRGWEVESSGNPYSHAILRGYKLENGDDIANYDYQTLVNLEKLFKNYNIDNPAVIIDTNHSNSNKNYEKQVDISLLIVNARKSSQNLKHFIKGLMIESYLEDGSKKIDDSTFGASITDPCLGIEKTINLIISINDLL